MCSDGDSFGEGKISGEKIEQREFHAAGTGQGGIYDTHDAEISAVIDELQATAFKSATAEVAAMDSVGNSKCEIYTHGEKKKPDKHDVSPYSDASTCDEG